MKTNPCRKKRLFLIANKLVSVITLFFFSAGYVFALPAGQQVMNGQAGFNTQGNNLTITNSPNAIINWQGFSINSNEAVRFIQQHGSSAVLNRVIGQDPSKILGLLQSNGRVFLINPNGILFGQGARIDVNGLVASTLNLSNQDFLAGKYNFTAGANAGAIENQGTITTPMGGKVFLIAPNIENTGIINSPQGDIVLAAGHSVYLVDSLDPDISVVVSAPANKAVNLGQIIAESGKVGIYGGLIQQKGIINANSAVMEGGRIFLKATKAIELADTSVISADGTKGGQIIAMTAENGQISGTLTGRGLLSAQGDGTSGSGGFIETSAAKVDLNGIRVKTNGGNWLIDPNDFTIAASGGDITGADVSNALSSGNVTYLSSSGGTAGNGDIFVNDNIVWSANKLTLNAYRNIEIKQELFGSGSAQLALYYGQGAVAVGNTAKYYINAPVNLPAGNNFFTKLGYNVAADTYTVITSLGVAGDPNSSTLQGMKNSLSGKYVLGSNIDASATSTWNSYGDGGYYGFLPIGTFNGIFDGLGHTITGLYINRTDGSWVGLFGDTSSNAIIRNIGLLNVNITGEHNTGGLVGLNYGTISNSYTTGSVTGTEDSGGLVGDNDSSGSITNSFSKANVTGTVDVGGLVGEYGESSNNTILSNSYSTGTVTGTSNLGGLVGRNGNEGTTTITGSFWDKSTSGKSVGVGSGISTGVTGINTTAEMKAQATYSGWDFTKTWAIDEGTSYPYHRSTQQAGYTNRWIGTVNSLWTTAGNWSLGHVPTSSENVFIDITGTPTITASSGSISFNNLWLNENLTIENSVTGVSGNKFTLMGGLAYFNYSTTIGSINVTGGTLAGSGLLTVSSYFNNNGGTVNRTGAMSITQSAGDLSFSAANIGALTLAATAGNITLGGVTSTGNITATASGAISQSAAVSGALLTTSSAGGTILNAANTITSFNATNTTSGNIALTNTAAPLTVTGISQSGGGNVTVSNTGAITASGSITTTASGNISLTATGGDMTLKGLIDAGTGNVTLKSGGAIINGRGSSKSISASYLTAEAANGIGSGDPLMTGVSKLTALNTSINNIEIDNTGVLTVSGLRNIGTGNVRLQNIGGITTDTSAVASAGGTVSITAHSPLTIGSGGVSAYSNISLEATDSDNLTINGPIASANGNIALKAGNSIVFGTGGTLSAPKGTITMTDGNASGSDQTVPDVPGNDVSNSSTLVALKTADGKTIATVEAKDDSDKKEDEDKKKKKEGGEPTSDDKKKETKTKNYCN